MIIFLFLTINENYQNFEFGSNILCLSTFIILIGFLFKYLHDYYQNQEKSNELNKDEENFISTNEFGNKRRVYFSETNQNKKERYLDLTPYFIHKISKTTFPPKPELAFPPENQSLREITYDINSSLSITHPNFSKAKSDPKLDLHLILENNILYAYEKDRLLSQFSFDPNQYTIIDFFPNYYVIYMIIEQNNNNVIIQRRMAGNLSLSSEIDLNDNIDKNDNFAIVEVSNKRFLQVKYNYYDISEDSQIY